VALPPCRKVSCSNRTAAASTCCSSMVAFCALTRDRHRPRGTRHPPRSCGQLRPGRLTRSPSLRMASGVTDRRGSGSCAPRPELARREYGSPPRLLGSVLRWNAFRMTVGYQPTIGLDDRVAGGREAYVPITSFHDSDRLDTTFAGCARGNSTDHDAITKQPLEIDSQRLAEPGIRLAHGSSLGRVA
jgi:hypothetical protein